MVLEQLEELKSKAFAELDGIKRIRDLESWRIHYLGKKSELTKLLRGLSALPLDDRKVIGSLANRLKLDLSNHLKQKQKAIRLSTIDQSIKETLIDITMPGRPVPIGRFHPITQTLNEICDIFISMGFQVVEGPEVEWDHYNFEALNIPKAHPARDTMSTLWIDHKTKNGGIPILLRTHTTAVSARIIEKMKPPIRVVIPGKVYRYEASDATHTLMFHQIDAIAVDKGITMADLKGTLYEFARRFFGDDRRVRFRCDYFPFVEPGVEMAVECLVCRGEGCRLCSQSGWLEVLGAGMTHPEVLWRGDIDPQKYTSFAFGIGIERLPMLRYGINDIRLFYGSDLRFLRQF
jgi:phenylalanyl-tRNA synthetase alpha chain